MKNLIGREIQSIHNGLCELDMINAITAADIPFIMSSSTSEWLLSPNKMAERFAFLGMNYVKKLCIIKQLLNSVFA